MSSQMVRWGGLAGLAAAVVFLVAAIVNLISPYQRGTFDSFSDYLYQLLVTVAFALIAVAIAGLYALQSGRYGRWGTAGASMAFVGYAICCDPAGGRRRSAECSLRRGGGDTRRLDSTWPHDHTRSDTAVVVRRADNRWLPPRRFLERRHKGGEGIVFAIVWGLVGWALLSRSGTPEEQPSGAS